MSSRASSTTRVALVTGGSKGIGAQTCLSLAKDGWTHIAINYSSDDKAAEDLVVEIEKTTGSKAKAFKADLGKVAECQKLVDDVVKHFGGLTLLVNNAALMRMKPISGISEADFDDHFNLNVKAPFFLAQASIPHLKPGVGGVIFLSTSLTAATHVQPTYITYNSTKGAIEQMSRVLAKDLGAKSIRVNTVSPGPTGTDLFLKGKSEELIKTISSGSPFGRLGKPEEIAEVITFLASDKAGWVSGQNIRVNGAFVV